MNIDLAVLFMYYYVDSSLEAVFHSFISFHVQPLLQTLLQLK